jgi:superfamily I DNA and/or RNA helicase
VNLDYVFFLDYLCVSTNLKQHLFIDEAGQASEPESAIPLAVVASVFNYPASGGSVKVVLSGDHMQVIVYITR